MITPQKLIVQTPDDAPPQPIPLDLADRLDTLDIDDGEAFWEVSRLVEFAFRRGYADGHARGYRDKDREHAVAARRASSNESTQGVRAVTPER